MEDKKKKKNAVLIEKLYGSAAFMAAIATIEHMGYAARNIFSRVTAPIFAVCAFGLLIAALLLRKN